MQACRPYLGAIDIIESTSKGAEESPDNSTQAVVNYFNYLGITLLDFVLITHAILTILVECRKLLIIF